VIDAYFVERAIAVGFGLGIGRAVLSLRARKKRDAKRRKAMSTELGISLKELPRQLVSGCAVEQGRSQKLLAPPRSE
jgi:hypothetical protein